MTYPQEPRWGDPQVPPDDPRSPEWRDPAAQPWWGSRSAQPPPGFPKSPMYAGPPPGPGRRKLAIIIGVAATLIIVLGIALAADHGSPTQPQFASALPIQTDDPFPNGGPIASDPPTADPLPTDLASPAPVDPPSDPATADDPVATTKAYYGDLAADKSSAAWDLLCDSRQQLMPLADYQAAYAQDVSTGTGIKTFTQAGSPQISGSEAAVPGTLVLADQESVPITVLLLQEADGWRVCSSDLGGVIPNPGTGTPGAGTVTT